MNCACIVCVCVYVCFHEFSAISCDTVMFPGDTTESLCCDKGPAMEVG